jgi:hypothetical protein
MNKLLTFGCSFTDYNWSTWADILGREFDDFQNHGRGGAGNTYIFNRIMQCIAENQITDSSTVIVMWSNVIREDRYVDGEWIAPGCIYNQNTYSEGFMDFVDPIGLFIRDCAHVAAVTHALNSTGCTYHFLSMMPIDNAKEYLKLKWTEKILASDTVSQYKRKYKKYLDLIKPSMLEVVYNNNWYNKRDDLVKDKTWYDNLTVPENWFYDQQPEDSVLPGLDNLYNCNDRVKSFLCNKMNAQSIDEIVEFKLWERIDHHPTPLLHLEYLQKVLPEYKISEDNIQRVINENSTLSI